MKISPILAVAAVAVVFVASFSTTDAVEEGRSGETGEGQFREYDFLDSGKVRADLPAEHLMQRSSCVRIRCRISPKPVSCWCIQWA